MRPEPMRRLDFVFSIVLTAFGLLVLVESLRMTRLEGLNVNAYTVPGIVPGFLGVLLALCGAALFVRSLLAGGWRLGLDAGAIGAFAAAPATRRVAMTLALTLIYALALFPLLPFWLGTALFVFGFIVLAEAMMLGRRPPWRAIAAALVLAVLCGLAIGFVFETLFHVRLPG